MPLCTGEDSNYCHNPILLYYHGQLGWNILILTGGGTMSVQYLKYPINYINYKWKLNDHMFASVCKLCSLCQR